MNDMNDFLTVELKQLRFFAYHGLYAEERKTGNEFEVNLSVSYKPGNAVIDDLHETVNYVTLYELLKTEMKKPRDLLETFLMEAATHIHTSFSQIKKIEICIIKLYPPMVQFTGTVGVKYAAEYND